MRETLAALDGQRLTVRATVLKFSRCIGWAGVRQPTILLGQVSGIDGEALADHIWLMLGKRMMDLDLHLGDLIEFSARVALYRRGLFRLPGEPLQFNTDYGLSYPTQCRVLAHKPEPVEELPADSGPTDEGAAVPVEKPVPALAARTRIVNTIERLWQEQGEPPTLPLLFGQSNANPSLFLKQLHKLGKMGTVVFQPDGRVFLAALAAPSVHVEARA